MNALERVNGPLAPSPSTVSRTMASPPYGVPHGATMNPPGSVCSIQDRGTA
ncbi:hypothetical protein ACIP3B_08690 [Streptomyces anulatus]